MHTRRTALIALALAAVVALTAPSATAFATSSGDSDAAAQPADRPHPYTEASSALASLPATRRVFTPEPVHTDADPLVGQQQQQEQHRLHSGGFRSLLQTAGGDGPMGQDWCSSNSLSDGSYSHPGGECDKFVLCSASLTYVFGCAECVEEPEAAAGGGGRCLGKASLAFNPDTRICEWPVNVPSCAASIPTINTGQQPSPPPPLPPSSDSTNGDFRSGNAPAGGIYPPSPPSAYGIYSPLPPTYGIYPPSPPSSYGTDSPSPPTYDNDPSPASPVYITGLRDSNSATPTPLTSTSTSPSLSPSPSLLLSPSPSPSSSSSPAPAPALSADDEILLDLRNSKPYAPIPGYGGADGLPYMQDPEDLAAELAGGDDGDDDGDDVGGVFKSNGGSSSSGGSGNSTSGGDPCDPFSDAASGTSPAPRRGEAEYSPMFEAPSCDGRGMGGCTARGLDGKGQGSEVDAPNTLYGECVDGDASGGADGGGARGYVAGVTLDAAEGVLRSGALGRISARVVCDATVPTSYVDFFFTGDTTMNVGRVWSYVSSSPCAPPDDGRGARPFSNATSLPFFLPVGLLRSTIAVRAQLRETDGGLLSGLPLALPCSSNSYGSNDRDDLVVQVCPAVSQPAIPASLGDLRSSNSGSGSSSGAGSDRSGGSGGGDGSGSSDGSGTTITGPDGNGAIVTAAERAARAAFYSIFSARVPEAQVA